MIFAPLFSSSSANSAFAGNKTEGVLIDAGASYKSLSRALEVSGISMNAVKAVLITHEHTDHINGLRVLTKNNNIPVFASTGTGKFLLDNGVIYNEDLLFDLSELKNASAIVNFDISAFRTPHDSNDSVGYVFTFPNGYKIAHFTDLGIITEQVREFTLGCNLAFIESNYDPDMLRKNRSYPESLKKRIASDFGHLSNGDSADYIAELVKSGTTRVILGHLSKQNNTPDIAYSNAVNRLKEDGFSLNRDYTLDVAAVQTEGKYVAV